MKKEIKSIVSVVLLVSMAFSIAGCARKIKPVEMNDFKDALQEEFDLDEYNYSERHTDSYTYIIYFGHDCHISYCESYGNDLDSSLNSDNSFRDTYNIFMDIVENNEFKGKKTCVFNEKDGYGYILFDGESNSDKFWPSSKYGSIYGGYYWTGDMLIHVVGWEGIDNDEYIKNVDAMIRALGYPKP